MNRIRVLPRKRTIVTGILAVGIAIGAWLSGLLPGLGLGSGDDRDATVSVDTSNQVQSPQPVDETIKAVSTQAYIADPEVLEVVIRDESYLVRVIHNGTESQVPVNLQRIIELAQTATGNQDGIRVVVLREPSARFLTWKSLENELVAAGIPADSVDMARVRSE